MLLFKPLAVAVAMALSTAAFAQSTANSDATQPSPDEASTTLETLVVTGSNLKGVDLAESQPVVIFSAEDIKESGAQTVTDLIAQLSETGGGTGNFSTATSGAKQADSPAGSAGISLRGLGTASTLTLINGRRIASASFANSSQNFVDVNMIPLSAIDRVEVLTTGASAIYGADAVAGVVNFVLREDFDGVQGSVSHGESEASSNDARSTANFLWGKSSEKGHALVVADFYQRAALYDRDRASTAIQQPNRSQQGIYPSFSNEFDDYFELVERSCPDAQRHDDSPLPAGDFGEYCEFNRNQFTATDPASRRIGVLGSFGYSFSDSLEWFADISLGRSESTANSEPAPWDELIDPNHPDLPAELRARFEFDPSEEGLLAFGRFVAPRTVNVDTDAARVLSGLRGAIGDWNWESAISAGQSKSDQVATAGIYNVERFRAALFGELCADGSTDCSPGSGGLYYNPFGGAVNNAPELLALLAERVPRSGESKLYSWDAKFNGAFGQIADREVQWAFGIEARREEIQDSPSALATADENGDVPVYGFGSTAASADRNSEAVFIESLLPLADTLDLRLAGRYDHYSDFGGDFNPAISLRWQPNDVYLVRAGWNSSFRAPSLAQVGAGTTLSSGRLPCAPGSEFATTLCGGRTTDQGYNSEVYGNPDLDAESAKAWYLGSVFNLGENTTLSLDYWNFKQNDLVDIDPLDLFRRALLDPSLVYARDALPRGQVGIETRNGTINSRLSFVQLQLTNVGEQNTDGLDISLTHDWDAGQAGEFRFYADATWTRSFERSESCDAQAPGTRRGAGVCINGQRLVDRSGEFRYPEWLATAGVRWRYGDFTTRLAADYTDSYYDDDQRAGVPAGRKVSSWTVLDLNVGWSPSDAHYVSLGVRNLLDRDPPSALGSGAGVDLYHHSSMGRFYTVSYEYRY